MRPLPLLIAAALIVALVAGGATAQRNGIDGARARLVAAKRAAEQARARSARLEQEAARAADAALQARNRAAAVAARIQGAEADITAAQARIAVVEGLRRVQARRLAEQQGPIVRLVAALQSLARRPSATTLVQPGSLTDLVHVRALLATTIPAIEARTAAVRGELANARRLRDGQALALRALEASRTRLASERLALARLEAGERVRSRALGRSAMVEQDRAIALGEDARDIVDLMDRIGSDAETRAALEGMAGPRMRPGSGIAVDDPQAVAVADAISGAYRLPVDGPVATGLGEIATSGARSRGITILPTGGATVVAPAGGKVAFAGRFRGYGEIVIIDHGGGWTSLIAGIDRLRVATGAELAGGAAIGRAPEGEPRVTVELRRGSRPVDIAPLLG